MGTAGLPRNEDYGTSTAKAIPHREGGTMVSIWWIVLALLMGAYAGAILVSLLTINRADDDTVLDLPAREEDARLVA